MIMNDSDVEQYPKFYQYLRNNFPSSSHIKQICNASKCFDGAAKRSVLMQGARWGNPPTVELVQDLNCNGEAVLGTYPKWGEDLIQLDQKLVDAVSAATDIHETLSGASISLAGLILLQQLEQWADAQEGKTEPAERSTPDALYLQVFGKTPQI